MYLGYAHDLLDPIYILLFDWWTPLEIGIPHFFAFKHIFQQFKFK